MEFKNRNINMFLLKGNISFKKYLKEDISLIYNLQIDKDFLESSENLTIKSGMIFIVKEMLKDPEWVDLINQFKKGNNKIQLDQRHNWAALVFMRFEDINETLLMTFGRTSGFFKEEYIINNFGIETAKQIVNSRNLNHIKIQSFDDRQTQTQKYSVKTLNENHLIDPFKLNSINSFLGNTRINNLNVRVGGTDSLRINGTFDIKKDLLSLIDSAVSSYKDRHLTEPQFKVKQNINPITNKATLKKLNKILNDKLYRIFGNNGDINGNSVRNISINPNKDMVDDMFSGYRFTSIGLPTYKEFAESELDIIDIFERVKKTLVNNELDSILRKLRNIKIHSIYEDSSRKETKSLYNSLYFEVVRDKINYILSDGKWYGVERNFYQLISNKISELNTTDVLNYPPYDQATHIDENDYNNKLASNVDALELDCTRYRPSKEIREMVKISPQSNIELADILNYDSTNQTLQFIHIKKLVGGASHTIHSFTQAKSSAQIFAYDKDNAEEFINIQREEQGFPPICFSDIKSVEIVISLIIPSSKKGNVSTPKKLFSILERISLYETMNIIYPLGFKFKLNFINSNL